MFETKCKHKIVYCVNIILDKARRDDGGRRNDAALVFRVRARGSNGGQCSVNSEGNVTRWQIGVDIDLTTRQYIPEDSELHTRRRENLTSLNEKVVCRWSWVDGREVFSAVYFPAMFVLCRMFRHLIYHFRRDGRPRREDRLRCFSITFNGRRENACKTVNNYGCDVCFCKWPLSFTLLALTIYAHTMDFVLLGY
jgi:hypothetical protein